MGDLHRRVPVNGEYRNHLEPRVLGDVRVGAVATENDAVAEAPTQRAAHLERTGDMREKAPIAEERDGPFRVAPVKSSHHFLLSGGYVAPLVKGCPCSRRSRLREPGGIHDNRHKS